MDLVSVLAGGAVGAFAGWVVALVLERLVPDPPQPRPTVMGWLTLALGSTAVWALLVGAASGALDGPLRAGSARWDHAVVDPAVGASAGAGAGLFMAMMAAGRVGDRHWPTGLGMLASGGVALALALLALSRVGELLLTRG